jgi:outer membrane biosynthesis protein TonB
MTLARSRRSLLVAAGFALAAAVLPATAAHADQAPAGSLTKGPAQAPTFQGPVDLISPGDQPQPPDPPDGPDDLANPTENPEPEPPGDLANPTENPEPEPPDGGDGDQSIPTPERVDTGLGGADRSQGPAVPVAALPLALAVLLLALVASRRRASTGSTR